MEFLFELFFELFGEIFVQVLFESLAEVGIHIFRKRKGDQGEGAAPSTWRLVIGYSALGLLAGAVSLMIFPNSLMHTRAGRITSLVLSPIASGLAMAMIGAWRKKRGQQTLDIDRFAYGYVFALAMALVRFNWAH
jgi:hypothetical protein